MTTKTRDYRRWLGPRQQLGAPTMLRFDCRRRLFVNALGLLAMTVCASAQASDPLPRLYTIDRIVEEVTATYALDVTDKIAVFDFIFAKLPDRVRVYPTENYYYFRFVHNGLRYAGNLRLDVLSRDNGKIEFAYYEELAPWIPEGLGVEQYVQLDASYGVQVERQSRLVYRVTYKGKAVIFALNDLSEVKPPAGLLAADERFIGPIFDESAIRFFLLFNTRLKVFYYVLDETALVPDTFFGLSGTDRIVIGRRTGFAFYRDHKRARKILIGVYAPNAELNSYDDGPFDQLPDNFIEGEELRDAIIASDPKAKGEIGRLGHYPDHESRYSIQPYMLYRKTRELLRFDRCARARIKTAAYYRCFVASE
jgi:hypothetical protein